MIKYRLFGTSIDAIEVVRETEKYVYLTKHDLWGGAIGAVKEAKRSEYQNWFDSWKEAHTFLLQRQRGIASARKDLYEGSLSLLNHVSAMKEPLDTGAKV